MNESDKFRDEEALRELIVSALDGDASEAQLLRLNEALCGDESLRRSARRFLFDDALLAEEIGTLDEAINILKHSAEPLGESNFPQDEQSCPQPHPSAIAESSGRSANFGVVSLARNGVRSALRFVNRHGLAVAAMAAFVMAGIGWHHLTLLAKFERLYSLTSAPDPAEHNRIRKDSQRAAIMPGPTSVARATAVVNCEWFDGESELEFGDQLSPGQRVRLKRGLLQLTFATGTRLSWKGRPTSWQQRRQKRFCRKAESLQQFRDSPADIRSSLPLPRSSTWVRSLVSTSTTKERRKFTFLTATWLPDREGMACRRDNCFTLGRTRRSSSLPPAGAGSGSRWIVQSLCDDSLLNRHRTNCLRSR